MLLLLGVGVVVGIVHSAGKPSQKQIEKKTRHHQALGIRPRACAVQCLDTDGRTCVVKALVEATEDSRPALR